MTAINSLSFPFLSLFLSSLSPDSLSFPFLSLRQRERKGRSRKEENKERKRKEKERKESILLSSFLTSLFFFFFFLFLFFFPSSLSCPLLIASVLSHVASLHFEKLSLKVCSIQSLYFIMLFFWSIPLNVSFSCTSIHSDLGWILAVFFENNLCRVSLTALFLGLNGL